MPEVLCELLDLPKLQNLLDGFARVTGITAAIIDNQGSQLVSSARPSLCAQFSDIAEEQSRCRMNRHHLLQSRPDQICSQSGHCPHGMVDAVQPIMLAGNQLGGLVIGQVFLKKPDFDFYCEEAKRWGYDADEYLQAVVAVPVVTEEQFENARTLMVELTTLLAEQAVARRQAEANTETARQHAERFIRELRRQKLQLQLYAMDTTSCSVLLESMLENTLHLVDSSSAFLFEYDEDSRLFALCGCSRSKSSPCTVMPIETVFGLEKSGLWGEAVRQHRPVITNQPAAADFSDLVRHLSVPIFNKDRIAAVVVIGNKESDYTEEDLRHLELFLKNSWNLIQRRKAEDELKTAKELAETSLKMKSELLSSLSHELRTPLNGVIGGSQLLRFTELTEEQDEFLGMVEEAAANELMLVNNRLSWCNWRQKGSI